MASITTKLCAGIARNAILKKFGPNQAARAMCTVINEENNLKMKHKPTDYEKKVLVWAKKYKNVNEVPEVIDLETMKRASTRLQLKFTNYGILILGGVCLYWVYNGHDDQKAHNTIEDENIQWHEDKNKAPGGTSANYFEKIANEGKAHEEAAKKTIK